MKDLRTLCDEAIQLWDAGCDMEGVINEMRDYLAQPEPEGPTDDELEKLADRYMVGDGATGGLYLEHIDFARAAIAADRARWGRPAINPVPINNTQE